MDEIFRKKVDALYAKRFQSPAYRPDQRPNRVLERASRGHLLRWRPLRHRDECGFASATLRLSQLSTFNPPPVLDPADLRLGLATKPHVQPEQLDHHAEWQRESGNFVRYERRAVLSLRT